MSEDEKAELRELQRALSRLGAWRQELIDWKREYARVMTTLNGMIGNLGKRVNDIKSGSAEIITDHALVRYLERFEGYDMDGLRDKIRELDHAKKTVINNNVITVGENLPPVTPDRQSAPSSGVKKNGYDDKPIFGPLDDKGATK